MLKPIQQSVFCFSLVLAVALGGCSSSDTGGKPGAPRATARTDTTDSTGGLDPETDSLADEDEPGQGSQGKGNGQGHGNGNGNGQGDGKGDGHANGNGHSHDHDDDGCDEQGGGREDHEDLKERRKEIVAEYRCLKKLSDRIEHELWKAKSAAVRGRDDGDSVRYTARVHELKEDSGSRPCDIETHDQRLTGRRAIREHIEAVQLSLAGIKSKLWELRRDARSIERNLRKHRH